MSRKRINKIQQDSLVEHLHSSLGLAKGDMIIASPQMAAFWAALTITLNGHGCRRTVAKWQSSAPVENLTPTPAVEILGLPPPVIEETSVATQPSVAV